ncbi:hypothetical protein [Alloactinosynnema sp. L-07]|uniref:hypothetical protein n=1 Tax=Alloactinosynnema sp. L-07 TaxID=1653480 RepID=UPI00065EF0BF|nr:hypothetical protein [Alloactinosynnema sp. L-07]CRK56898.1 hypothetical protein [Alloactinosynnema sp. L-07]
MRAVVAAVLAVLAASAGGAVMRPSAVVPGDQPGTWLGSWPASWSSRGVLASSTGLIERAVAAWRQAPDPTSRPVGDPRVLYADRSTPGTVNLVSVVLAAGRQVAWVSTPTTTGAPAVQDPLLLRAVTTVTDDAWGIGFVATAPLPGDAAIRGGGAVSIVLAAPDTRSWLVSSALDMGLVDTDAGEEVATRVVQSGVAAWNSTVHSRRGEATHVDPVAAGTRDPATLTVTVTATGTGPQVSDGSPGDWVITGTGWLGVVGEGHQVDTAMSTLPATLRAQLAITGEPLTIDGNGRLSGVPATANPGNRVVLAGPDGVRINLGHLAGDPAMGWVLARAVPAATTGPALLWTGHR